MARTKTLTEPFALVSCTFVFLCFVLSCSGEPSKPQSGYLAPDFTLTSLEGVKYTLSDLKGKVVFVNLWATWCPPCRQELPSMVQFYDMFQKKDLEILSVSEDADMAAVKEFVNKYRISFPVLIDDRKDVYRLYRATGIPETHLIDKTGRIVFSSPPAV